MVLFMLGGGKASHDTELEALIRTCGTGKCRRIYIKLIIEKCHNSLLFQQLELIEPA